MIVAALELKGRKRDSLQILELLKNSVVGIYKPLYFYKITFGFSQKITDFKIRF